MLPLTARETARRLIAREQSGGTAPVDAAPAEQVVRRLSDDLVEWFGPYATHALFTRALARARAEHPVLAAVRVGAPAKPNVEGLADSARTHGVGATAAAAVGLLAALVELLGRLIGDDLAITLVEQSVPLSAADRPPPRVGGVGGTTNRRAAGGGASAAGDTTGSTRDE
jgi:hypothetical protein